MLQDQAPQKATDGRTTDLNIQSPATDGGQQMSSQKTNENYRFEHGRRYHERKDVAYFMPDDDAENNRTHQQHWILKVVSHGNYNAPVERELESGIKVLDGGLFPDNHFGLIHQRLLVGGLLIKDWEKAINEHTRTLTPGGWIEIMEYNFVKTVEHAGPNLAIMFNGLIAGCDMKGMQGRTNEVLEGFFELVGLVNIQIKVDEYPMDQGTQLSRLAWDNISEAFVALKPVVSKALPELEDDDSYDRFVQETKTEVRNRKSVVYRIFGQNPQ